ncbi:MAG: transposase [Cognaticolwellia sp.]|jgi:transposase
MLNQLRIPTVMAYSKEFRGRVVRAYQAGHVSSYRHAAEIFGLGESTVKRWVWSFQDEGRIQPREMGGLRIPRKIGADGDAFIRSVLLAEPTLVSGEMCHRYAAKFGVSLSTATMRRNILELGFTVKRGAGGPLREIGPTSLPVERRSTS